MSDPNYRDPRLDPKPLQDDDLRSRRLNELESSNAMWGWVAGAVVLAMVMVFVFTRGQVENSPSASLQPPAATTGSAPPANMPPAQAQIPRPEPSTTGQSSPAPTPEEK